MGSKDSFGKAARAAQENPYLQRLLDDEDLRANLLAAYGAARSAYGRLSNGKPPTQALFEDEKLQQELARAVGSLRDATSALREAPSAPTRSVRRRGGAARTLLVLGAGAILAIALNERLRSKVLDLMFGAEEEFDYTSTTTPATPEPAGVGA
jgi:ferric-dicitrate binding protein FerR (iron transport regulator)